MPRPTEEQVFAITRQTVIDSITGYIRNRQNVIPNFQILDLVIPTERKIRSIVGGMETSLGTTLWEPLAKSLAVLNDFEVVNDNLLAPTNYPANLQNTLNILEEGRLNGGVLYNAQYCHDRIREVCQDFIQNPIGSFRSAPKGFGVDIWLRKDDINYFFDTKTVQPNLGGYTRYFKQILNWYAYFYSRYPESKASARVVFPYNPYGDVDFWQRTMGRGFPLEPAIEGWVQDQFWNFCSGVTNTYSIILRAFRDISESGDLEDIVQEIFYGDN